MHPTEIADRYFEQLRARNLEGVMTLFAAHARCIMPDGRSFEGDAAIREWFNKLFAMQAPRPRPIATVAGHDSIAVEVESELADGSIRHTANFFHLDASGQILQLHAYKRG